MTHSVNVRFGDQAYKTVENLAVQQGLSMGEVLRRALTLYIWYRENRAAGNRLLVERPNGSAREVVSLF